MMENDKDMSKDDKVTQEIADNETVISQSEHDNDLESSEEKHDQEDHPMDFSQLSKKELLEELKGNYSKGDYLKSDALVNELKSAYDDFFEKEREEALQNFIKEGGSEDDFQYRKTDQDKEFFKTFNDF